MSTTAFLSTALALACLGLQAAAPGDLISLGKLEQTPSRDVLDGFKAKLDKDLAGRSQDLKTFGPLVVYQQMFQERVAATVASRGFTYASRDAHGHERLYSARVFLPPHKPNTPPLALPLVIYQHATETRRKYTPYYLKGDETMLGAMAAEMGEFAVVMPDGDGMGADPSPEMHAYCHGPTTAQCLLDCIRAAKSQVKDTGDRIFDDVDYGWDNRTFIVGYSEGGYIAMAAVKELSTNSDYSDIKLTGAACMGGPFSFSASSQALFAKGNTEPYDRPYIPAYFLDAWHSVYPDVVDFDAGINPKLKSANPDESLGKWLDEGILGGDQLSPKIQQRLTGKPDQLVPAREILDPAWLADNLDNKKSHLLALFRQNDLVGGWAPSVPVLLVHDPYDRTVGYDNSAAAFQAWKSQGANPVGIVDLALGGKGSGHVGGAVLAIPTAFVWIAAGMPRSLMDLAKQKVIYDTIRNLTPKGLEDGGEALATALTGDRDEDQALLPLSRLALPRNPGPKPYVVTFNDTFVVVGKVKLYTLQKNPQFQGQTKLAGTNGYTKLFKEMRKKGDRAVLDPNDPALKGATDLYLAVYPQNAFVALTLKFAGGPKDNYDEYTINIKQALKNKVTNRDPAAYFSISKNFTAKVNQDAFERPDSATPFITLP